MSNQLCGFRVADFLFSPCERPLTAGFNVHRRRGLSPFKRAAGIETLQHIAGFAGILFHIYRRNFFVCARQVVYSPARGHRASSCCQEYENSYQHCVLFHKFSSFIFSYRTLHPVQSNFNANMPIPQLFLYSSFAGGTLSLLRARLNLALNIFI